MYYQIPQKVFLYTSDINIAGQTKQKSKLKNFCLVWHFVLIGAKIQISLQLPDLDKYYEHVTSTLWTLTGNQILSGGTRLGFV